MLRVMRRYDLTEKETITKTNTKTETITKKKYKDKIITKTKTKKMTKTSTFRDHFQSVIPETCDLCDI